MASENTCRREFCDLIVFGRSLTEEGEALLYDGILASHESLIAVLQILRQLLRLVGRGIHTDLWAGHGFLLVVDGGRIAASGPALCFPVGSGTMPSTT